MFAQNFIFNFHIYLLSTAIAIINITTATMNRLEILIEVRVTFCGSFDDFFNKSSSSNSLNNDRRTESSLLDIVGVCSIPYTKCKLIK